MKFTTIQTGQTTTRFYINGQRVTKDKFEQKELLATIQGKQFNSFSTKQIAADKFRHTKFI